MSAGDNECHQWWVIMFNVGRGGGGGGHQEKPTVPFITIDHYRSLFVTFVAISAIIALWHP